LNTIFCQYRFSGSYLTEFIDPGCQDKIARRLPQQSSRINAGGKKIWCSAATNDDQWAGESVFV
jgi:hypothetical protein